MSPEQWTVFRSNLSDTLQLRSHVEKGLRYNLDVPALVAEIESLRVAMDTIPDLVVEVERLREESRHLYDNLGATQKRCTELIDITRAQRWFAVDARWSALCSILEDVFAERYRQDCKWGEIGPKDCAMPDGTGGADAKAFEVIAKDDCKRAESEGRLHWRHILEEEVAETFAETDPVKLRAELVQVAAVACKWLEAMDRRGAR